MKQPNSVHCACEFEGAAAMEFNVPMAHRSWGPLFIVELSWMVWFTVFRYASATQMKFSEGREVLRRVCGPHNEWPYEKQ